MPLEKREARLQTRAKRQLRLAAVVWTVSASSAMLFSMKATQGATQAFTWNNSAGGNWSVPGNWTTTGTDAFPTDNADSALFNGALTGTIPITVDTTSAEATFLQFGGTGNYTISGTNAVLLSDTTTTSTDTNNEGAGIAYILNGNTSGTNTISAPINLSTTNTTGFTIDQENTTNTLTVSGAINAGGLNVIVKGAGTVTLSGGLSNTAIGGNIGLNVTGTSATVKPTLNLGGTNSYAGQTSVNTDGTLNLTGSITNTSGLALLGTSGTTGSVVMTLASGASLTVGSTSLFSTAGSTFLKDGGTFTQNGGTSIFGQGGTSNSADTDIGLDQGGKIATFNMAGGNSTIVQNLVLGSFLGESSGVAAGSGGALVVTAGVMTVEGPSGVVLANAGSTGAITLTGGTLITNVIARSTVSPGSGTFNFNGGTLEPGASTTTFLQGLTSATVNNGALINTNSFNITIAQNLLSGKTGDGGLNKSGAGILTLAGVNSYNGETQASAGSIAITGSVGSIATPSKSLFLDNASLTLSGSLTVGNANLFGSSNASTFIRDNGSFTQTAGTSTFGSGGGTADNTDVGLDIGGTNTFAISGGASTMLGNLYLAGFAGNATNSTATTGVLTISGTGSLTVQGTSGAGNTGIILGSGGSAGKIASGVVNLNGGTLITTGISISTLGTNDSATVDFNGGTLQPSANNASFLQGLTSATVDTGGAVVNTNAFNVTIAQNLTAKAGVSNDGGLTKNGAGILTLTGTNAYNGPTTINAGVLLANNPSNSTGAGSVTVNASATLGGSGTILGQVVLNGGRISPGIGGSPAVLTFAGLAGSGTSTFLVNITGAGETAGGTAGAGHNYDSLVTTVSGAFLNGTILTIADTGVVASGTYDIFQNAGADGVTFGEFFTTASGQTLTNGTVFNDGQNTFAINYNTNSAGTGPGTDIVLTTVATPEPASLALLGMCAAGLLARRRRIVHGHIKYV